MITNHFYHQRVGKSKKYFTFLLFIFLSITGYSQTPSSTIIPVGSYIIDMGIVPQTVNNGLRPYGLVYALLQAHCPVNWIINTSKAKDGADFTYNGYDFKGGTFIVEAKYRNPSINALISTWAPADQTGVIGITTTSAVTVPLYLTFWSAPRWTLDIENGAIAQNFFLLAGIPDSAYGGVSSNWKTPAQLNDCDDVYVMPHAEPTWATHSHLFDWVNGTGGSIGKGSIWVGCVGGSDFMDMYNNVTPDYNQQTNFLVDKSGPAIGPGPYSETSLILWQNHLNGNPPYSYDYSGEPVMQFIGTTDAAQQAGYEQIYIPSGGNEGWFLNTHPAVYDPNHPQRYNLSNKTQYRAASIVYGPGMGIVGNGDVMLEGGHNISGSAPANIAAQRAFFNFSFYTAWKKAVVPKLNNLPDTISSTKSYPLSYTTLSNTSNAIVQTYTTAWTSSEKGTWSPDSTSQTPSFTPAAVSVPTPCTITIEITDNCGRKTFDTHNTIILPCILTVSNSITSPVCFGDTNGSINLVVSGGTAPFNWSYTRTDISSSTVTGSGTSITGLSVGTYSYSVSNGAGCNSGLIPNVVVKALSDLPATPVKDTIIQPTCKVATGSVKFSGLPATGTWTLTRTPGNITVSGTGTTTTITGLATGSYSFNVTNSSGCSSAASAQIVINSQPVTPSLPIIGSVTQPTCSIATGNVLLSGLPATGNWILTRTPDGKTLSGTGTGTIITGLFAGTYSYSVTNTFGCTSDASANVVINAQPLTPLAPIAGIITQPTCASATGNVILTGLPATGTWTVTNGFDGSTLKGTGTSALISALSPGNYTFTVTNESGCTSGASVVVAINSQPVTPAAATIGVITQPSCTVATGDVILNGLPSSGTWTIATTPGGLTITGSKASTKITGLETGTYFFNITNSDGCTSVASSNVVINPQPLKPAVPIVANVTQPTCLTATGQIELSGLPASGTWILTSSFDGSILTGSGSTTTLNGLLPGTYSFTVTNEIGCISVYSASIIINAQPIIPTSPTIGIITQPTCTSATGSVVLNGLPDSGNWTITQTQEGLTTTGSGTIATITGLSAGSYNFKVTNSLGCTSTSASSRVDIAAQPSTPTAPIVGVVTQPTCEVATGNVVLSGLPDTGIWTLTRTPDGSTISGTGTSKTITGIGVGTFAYTVTNSSGCTSASSEYIVINLQSVTPNSPLVGAVKQPTCSEPTGVVILNGLPATGAWTLIRTPDRVTTTGSGTTATITNLAAGTYNYAVINSLGCISPATANIVINPQPVTPAAPVLDSIIQPTCILPTGSVVLIGLPSGGIWSLIRNPDGFISTGAGPTTTVAGLSAGTYSFSVLNSDGCTSAGSANIVVNPQPLTPVVPVISTITQPTCTIATGSVELSGLPSRGSWTLTRIQDGVTTTGVGTTTKISGLAPGTYNYNVNNGSVCNSAQTADIVINTQPATPAIPLVSDIIQPTCGLATGSVTLSGLPGSGIWTLVRTPNEVTTGTGKTSLINGLPSGAYSYAVKNAEGCNSASSSIIVINPQPAKPDAPTLGLITQPGCTVSTGEITISAPLGTGLTYSIDGEIFTNSTGIFTQMVSGTYQVLAKNQNGCISTGTSVTILPATQVLALAKAEVTSPIICNGGTATVTLTSTGGKAPIIYTFNGASNGSGVFDGIPAGLALLYSITDANGCGPVTGILDVKQPVALGLEALPPVNVTCKGAANGSINLAVSNGTAPFSYAWTGPGSFNATSEAISGLSGGTYNVKVTDANGCSKSASATVKESVAPLTATATATSEITRMSLNGATTLGVTGGSINLSVSGGTGPFTYSWTGPDSYISDIENPLDLKQGSYSVDITDSYGCTIKTSALVNSETVLSEDENCVVFVPNSFSPNGDGVHDTFQIKCLYNYANPHIEIYNRWGSLVYKKDHYGDVDFWGSEANAWWDGRSDGNLTIGSQELPTGTYFYLLKLNNSKELKGFLFLNK